MKHKKKQKIDIDALLMSCESISAADVGVWDDYWKDVANGNQAPDIGRTPEECLAAITGVVGHVATAPDHTRALANSVWAMSYAIKSLIANGVDPQETVVMASAIFGGKAAAAQAAADTYREAADIWHAIETGVL